MSHESHAIDLQDLTVHYGKAVAVDGVSLAIPRGSVYALLGRNGAGKSSLTRCLLGVQKPTRGSAHLFGQNAWQHRAKLMERVGVVAEDPDAPPEMSSREIVTFCARLYPKFDQKAAMDRIARVGASPKLPFGRLSKGQKRQVLLAVALASSPELLVLDDPTLGLDVVARKELFEELISDLADRVGIVKNGQLVLNEDLETLKWRFRRIRYASAPTAEPQLEQLQTVGVRRWGGGIEAVVSNYDDMQLERFRSSAGVRDVEVTPMSLEEIFIAVAGDEKGEAS